MGIGNYGLFSWKTLLTKAGVNATATAVIFAVVGYISHGRATNDWTVTPDLQAVINMGIAAGMAALWAAGKNWAKNHPSSPLSKVFMTVAVVAAVAMSGCGTMGTSRPLIYDMEFGDKVGGDAAQAAAGTLDAQNTTFKVHVKAPAGTKLEDIVGMKYDWNADGSGKIAVSKQAQSDQTGQAELIKALAETQRGAFNDGVTAAKETVGVVAPLAAPLLGQKISADAAVDTANAANRAALQQMIADAIKEALKAQKPKTPKPEVTPEPVVTLPGN